MSLPFPFLGCILDKGGTHFGGKPQILFFYAQRKWLLWSTIKKTDCVATGALVARMQAAHSILATEDIKSLLEFQQ